MKTSTSTIAAALTLMCLAMLDSSRANSEMREWRLNDGRTINAEIERFDEDAEVVTLMTKAGDEVSLKKGELALLDQAWLLEWVELAEELEDKITSLGGRFEHFQAQGETTVTDFYVYHPSGQTADSPPLPMMILFDPSGKGRRYLLRHIEAGEAAKITLIGCDVFRNRLVGGEARFAELFPIIQNTVKHDPQKVFLGGTSGGACRAYHYTSMPLAKWAGVYANGGWLGGMKRWNLPFQKGMRVAMVNGNNDMGAADWAEADAAVLANRDILVSFHAFEGGHQIPPTSVQTKAFRWLIGDGD